MASIVFPFTVQGMGAFADRIKALRVSRKLTQARLAELVDVNPRAYNRWERGNFFPHLDTAIKLADVLNVSLDELTGRSTSVPEPAVHNPKLNALLRQVDALPDGDQQALIVLMDSVVKRAKMDRILAAWRFFFAAHNPGNTAALNPNHRGLGSLCSNIRARSRVLIS